MPDAWTRRFLEALRDLNLSDDEINAALPLLAQVYPSATSVLRSLTKPATVEREPTMSTMHRVNIPQFIKLVASCSKMGLTVYAEGPPGVGKSKSVLDWAMAQKKRSKGKFGICYLDGANASLMDLVGVLMKHEVTYKAHDGTEYTINEGRFTFPHYLMDFQDHKPFFCYPRGVVVIDEYGQMGNEEKRSTSTLQLERRAGNIQLPDGWQVIVLSNRPEDRSGTGRDYDHMINRRMQVSVVPEIDAIAMYGHKKGWDPETVAFARNNANILIDSKVPEKQGPWCTPRSLDRLDEWSKTCGFEKTDPLWLIGAGGIIGQGAAAQYQATARCIELLPTYPEVVRDPMNAKFTDRTDAQMLAAYILANKVKYDDMGPVVRYMRRLPQSFALLFFTAIRERDETLVSHKAIGDWAIDNYDLLAAINAKGS
jgi:hypothetical protein